MDKQKQIEEMAVDIAKRDCYLWGRCPKEPKHNCVSQDPKIMFESSKNYITTAIWLVNAGYRKIPENAVVLTGTETEEKLEDLLVDFDEMSFFPATLTPNPDEYAREWKRKLIYAIGQVCKEMLTAFAERIKAHYPHTASIQSTIDKELKAAIAGGVKL